MSAGTEQLPTDTIGRLAQIAVASENVYDATAAMDVLFDAYESFDEIFNSFEELFENGEKKSRKRVICCLGYLTKGGINRRSPLRKPAAAVRADYDHFQSFVHRTNSLARKLQEEL